MNTIKPDDSTLAKKEQLEAELIIANKELAFQDEEKINRAAELIVANKELAFQNDEKEKRAAELVLANKELAYQNQEKEKRAAELIIANTELVFQNDEKEKRAAELIVANHELAFQNDEKEKRAAELILANKELAYQNEEKEKLAAELIIANTELVFQNVEKEKRAADLAVLSEALQEQKEELKMANDKLYEKKILLELQEEKLIRINEGLEKRVFERTVELEKLNDELKGLNISKDKFLTVISHDLRNPLTALLLASEELKKRSEDHSFKPVLPVVEIIHRSSLNILHQLNDLVAWAKNQKDKASLHLEKVHLFSAVNDSFELLKTNISQKNIAIENKVSTDIYVNADAHMLRSILQNLVTNSIKYSLQGGLVTVTAKCNGMLAEVFIIDTGIGMDANTKDNLFINPNSTSGTNNETGSGLGLMLVKDFVTQHGGTVRAESEIKKGTSIIFSIPLFAQA